MNAARLDKIKRIERGMATMARVIQHHGDKYWCLFERLEAEHAELTSRDTRLQQALERVEAA